ncbi:hypothetical protein, partial [Nocardiopsis sp. LOL_012]|uniref:hypothetical protein n=1 Tax=Nocardiopsis sp. LOL_012 TaxID=3345409 RepID=UPI003A85F9FF
MMSGSASVIFSTAYGIYSKIITIVGLAGATAAEQRQTRREMNLHRHAPEASHVHKPRHKKERTGAAPTRNDPDPFFN